MARQKPASVKIGITTKVLRKILILILLLIVVISSSEGLKPSLGITCKPLTMRRGKEDGDGGVLRGARTSPAAVPLLTVACF